MTTPTPVRSSPAIPVMVTVAVLGATVPSSVTLRAALDAAAGNQVTWRVISGETGIGTAPVHIVLCDDPVAAAAAAQRWPAAVVVALVPARQQGTAPGTAPDPAGAPGVLRLPSGDLGLVAAYVRSIARRRGLIGGDATR
jgi:hypothetical protein